MSDLRKAVPVFFAHLAPDYLQKTESSANGTGEPGENVPRQRVSLLQAISLCSLAVIGEKRDTDITRDKRMDRAVACDNPRHLVS